MKISNLTDEQFIKLIRFLLAAIAMNGICANPDCEPEDVKHNAIIALRNADALLDLFDDEALKPPTSNS